MKKETAYQRRGCSIFCKILHSLLLVLLAEMLLLIFAISTSRVTSQLNENAEDILDKQVENRANYLRQNLIQAQDLNAISGTIDRVTQELVDQGIVNLNTLDTSSEEALPLLQAIVPELVSTLRTKPVNGIFVILSTHDLNHRADDSYLPGLYIRDLDPSALSTDRNADLLAEREENAALREENAMLEGKAAFYDLFIDLKHSTNLRTTAKELVVPERRFVRFLLEQRFVYRAPSGNVLPYAKPANDGLFTVKDYCNHGHTGSYTLVTPQGKLYFAQLRDSILVMI